MTISPVALAAKKVIDAAWLHGPSYELASQAAFALESAQLLQSPEKAAELVALRNDALNMRGALSPNGFPRRVPMPLGKELAPVVEWLLNRVSELEAERHTTNEALSDAAEALRIHRDRVAALAERLRAGQEWQRGRDPELVSENLVSQSELRGIFGIPLTAPWGDAVTRRIAPTQALREDASVETGGA